MSLPQKIIFSKKKVIARWYYNNKEWYESRGYKFSAYKDFFEVDPVDLTPSCRLLVEVVCPRCGEERRVVNASIHRNKSTHCQSCANEILRHDDISGQRFGRLVALSQVGKSSNGKTMWRCACDCGNKVSVRGDSLKSGNTSSCGCYQSEVSRESIKGIPHTQRGRNPNARGYMIEMAGNKYGRLTVIEFVGNEKWKCLCDCGNTTTTKGERIRSGKTRSCGCYELEMKSGSNNKNWNPNLTEGHRQKQRRRSKEYRDLIQDVFARDRYTCLVCEKTNTRLNMHHLYDYSDYPEYRKEESNCITLCHKCHWDFHNWMGGTIVSCTPDDFKQWISVRGFSAVILAEYNS